MDRYISVLATTAIVLLTLGMEVGAADVSYISGGIGADMREELLAKEKDYNLKVVVAEKSGDYLAGVLIVIESGRKEQVLGILYVLAMISLGVYGLMMAALLGGQRAAALMITAEVALGASIMGVVMVYGALNMQDIARGQGQPLLPQFFGTWIPAWGLITQPAAFILFLTAGIASTKRIPFDTPEGESEIIGYFVEYSGMKFGMFAMADFLETVVIAGMTTALFLGGWQVPYLQASGFVFPWGASIVLPHLAVVGLQVVSFLTKVVIMIWFLMLIRWTLPRFRYDQAMRLGWLALFPLSVLNILVTALVLLAVGKG